MDHHPYDTFSSKQLLLRDYLALDRTSMANERTLLAYIRTALALVVVGGSLLKFFDDVMLDIIGIVFIMIAIGTTALGIVRFRQVYRLINRINAKPVNIQLQDLADDDGG
jgi:putative membrane protein